VNKIEKEANRLKARLARWIAKIVYSISTYDRSDSKPVSDDSTAIPEPETKPTEPEKPVEEVKPSSSGIKIVSFGHPDCSKASEDPNTQIKDLKMSSNGLSYRWAKGNLRNWGIKDDHSAKALAIAGYGDGKTFRAAKFDWISSDRLTRDFENIRGGYNGFKYAEFQKAKVRCFFIMSEDGKRRTNILTD
jgi:hypothetical protein